MAITLERGFSLEGTVLDEDGQPLPNRMVDVSPADAGARKRTVETDEHGTFRVGGLSEGRYTLTVLTAAFLGDTDVLASATADVPAMQRLVLRALSFGRISGTVVDEEGRPVWGAEVDGSAEDRPELDPNAPYAGASWRTASSDQQGHFELRRLREGTFRVTAAATADDDLRSSLVAGPVSVRAGEAQIVLKLRPGERIEIEPLDLGTSAE